MTAEGALRALDRRGAHLVRCRGDKTPAGPWRHPAPIARVVEHDARGGMTGIVPGSIHSVVVDHDVVGDWSRKQLPLFDPPLVRLETPNGLHDWYDKRDPAETVRNRQWEIGDSSGDIRGDKGYVCLHGGAAERLARALDTRGANERHLFPADLFAAADIVLERRLPPPKAEGDAAAAGDYARARRDAADVQVGQRNCWLFDEVRKRAYRRRKDFWRYEHWKAEVRHLAYETASGLTAPLPAHEIESTARSVAGWCFVNLPPRVAARKGAHAAAAVKRERNKERDRKIVHLRNARGMSWRAIAAVVDMHQSSVRHVYARMTAIDDEPPLRL